VPAEDRGDAILLRSWSPGHRSLRVPLASRRSADRPAKDWPYIRVAVSMPAMMSSPTGVADRCAVSTPIFSVSREGRRGADSGEREQNELGKPRHGFLLR
jgi:hypothetical protein